VKVSDILSYSFSAIKLRKLRAGLTTLGVVIGIAAIVALLSITQGLQNTITMQLETGLATNTLTVSAGGGFGAGGQGRANSDFKLRVNYTEIIDDLSPDIEMSVAIIQRVCWIKFGEKELATTIVGVDFAKYADIYSSTFVNESGQIPQNPENNMLVIGKRVNDPWKNGTLFCDVNDDVNIIWTNTTTFPIKNETYTGHVAAVLKEVGGFGIGGPSDSSIYIPISQAQSFFGTDECSQIIVKLKNSNKETIDNVSKAITDAFSNQVSVMSATAMLNTLSSVFSVIELFLAGIAAISLLVAGIGIMNIMIVSLMERTREIGILKALGMKGRTVLLIFLFESVIIGLIGSVIGIGSGWGVANLVMIIFSGGGLSFGNLRGNQTGSFGMTITPLLTPTVAVLALVFGVGVSVIFAIYPAWRASKLKPVEALRYE
jgi:putative ABC transport system permease protein